MVNLSAIDLNLLVALDALLAERSVSLAAKRVGLSQPAMSNALSRLRKLFDDAVLVRTGRGMEPTPRALELAAPIHQALDDLRRTLGPPPFFDPKTSPYRFRIECTDDVELSLLPRITQRVAALAPRVELAISRVTRATEDALRSGRSDLYLGTWSNVPASFHRYLVRQESFRCIARKGHPRIKARLTLRAYAELGHVLCGPAELPGGVLDAKLADEGVGRRVVVRTPSVHAVALIVARSNLIATLPRTLADTFADLLPLQVHRPPLDADSFAVEMVWHPRTHQQAPHRWLREQVMRARDAESEAW